MIPILFPANATEFTTHGIGDLVEAAECKAKVTDEGEFELSFTYPMTGELFSELENSKIVVAKVEAFDLASNPYPYQAFRIYGFEKTLDGMIQVNCQHISYDLSGIPVRPFKNITNASAAVSALMSNAFTTGNDIIQPESDGKKRITCNFTIATDIPSDNEHKPNTDDGTFKIEEPISMRAVLLDGDDSIKGAFGGDLIFNNFNVMLKNPPSVEEEKPKVILEYGVDIMDLSVENNISEMFTDVVGYWKGKVNSSDADDTIVYGSLRGRKNNDELIEYPKRNATVVDLTEFFQTVPTREQIDLKTEEWIVSEHIGEPEINVTVSYAKLDQDVHMHDAVTVRFPKMGIDVTAKVCSYSYDVLNEMCTEVEVGNAKSSAAWKGLEDASRLKRGLLPPKRIADHSITSSHLGYGSVGSAQLDDLAVTPEKVVDGLINDAKKIVGGILDSSKFTNQLKGYMDNLPSTAFDAEWAAGRVNNMIAALKNASNFSDFKDATNKDAKPTT